MNAISQGGSIHIHILYCLKKLDIVKLVCMWFSHDNYFNDSNVVREAIVCLSYTGTQYTVHF